MLSITPQPLRLASMTRAKASALCELFCQRESLRVAGEPATNWRFALAAAQRPDTTVVLQGAGESLSLSLAEDGLREPVGVREWWDYAGVSRLLAFTLAHGALLDALGRALQDNFLPERLSTLDVTTSSDSLLSLDFAVTSNDGRRSTGVLDLSPAVASRLAAQPGWQPPDAAAALPAWAHLPGALRLCLPAVTLPLHELREAAPGDLLVVGPRTHCSRNMLLVFPGSSERRRSWPARYDGRRLEVTGSTNSMESIMSEPTREMPGAGCGAAAAAVLEALPIVLDFEVATLPLSLAELSAVRPGYVFQLTDRLEDARVVIRANGARVGHGRLVCVGDTLAVQLLDFEMPRDR